MHIQLYDHIQQIPLEGSVSQISLQYIVYHKLGYMRAGTERNNQTVKHNNMTNS